MKSIPHRKAKKLRKHWKSLLGLCLAGTPVLAAETNAPPAASSPLTPEQMFEGGTNSYNNWIDTSVGGFTLKGNRNNFQQQEQMSGRVFGGIEGFHFGTNIDKTTTLTLDGRGIFDEHNYDLKLAVQREKVGFLRVSYNEFRTWSDGDGGFFSPGNQFFPLNNSLGLDRGALSVEAGYTPEKGINAIFKYTRTFRQGEENSTEWGDAYPGNGSIVQGLSPSYDHFDEHTDNFQLDLTDHIKKTDLGLGMNYQNGYLSDTLLITQYPGESVQQKITDQQTTTYDMYEAHAFSETWFKSNIFLSSGFAYSHIDNNFSGSRIYGSDFDVGYVPNAQYGEGYFGLGGKSHMNEYVMDANLFYKPTPYLTVTPSLRLLEDGSDSATSGFETLAANRPVYFTSDGNANDLDVRARLDIAYTRFTNWVLNVRSDFTEADGNLDQNGGLIPIGGIGVPGVQSGIEERNFVEKYSASARWYESRRATLDFGGYYKLDDYHYANSPSDSSDYPNFLEMQNFATYDANTRLTLRLKHNISLVSRYEYQWSTIHTAPNPPADLPTVESSAMRSHIIAQDVSWIPWPRVSLQAGLNYVISDTSTPGSDATQSILDARNNYWTVNFVAGYVLDNKTDLNLSYVYYDTDDYVDDEPAGVSYGAGGQEHAITATLTRRINERIRLSLKYGYFRYIDEATGGNANFSADLIYATLRYRF